MAGVLETVYALKEAVLAQIAKIGSAWVITASLRLARVRTVMKVIVPAKFVRIMAASAKTVMVRTTTMTAMTTTTMMMIAVVVEGSPACVSDARVFHGDV